MRERLIVAAASCVIAVAACSASRQPKPELPAPEYEPARALPAASSAASAAQPSSDSDADQEGDTARARGERIGGEESAGKPKDEIREAEKPDLGESSVVPAKPIGKSGAARKRDDKPEPAASPEAPPSPTMLPAQPAKVPAR